MNDKLSNLQSVSLSLPPERVRIGFSGLNDLFVFFKITNSLKAHILITENKLTATKSNVFLYLYEMVNDFHSPRNVPFPL